MLSSTAIYRYITEFKNHENRAQVQQMGFQCSILLQEEMKL